MMEVLFSNTLSWIALSFVVFVGIFYKLAWPQIIGGLDKRIYQIRVDIETAEQLKAQAEVLLKEYQEKQQQAASEAKQIIADAKTQADVFAKAESEKLDDLIARKEAQLADRLSRMKEQAIADIRTEVAQLATRATQELITSNIDTTKGRTLIQSSLDKVN